MTTKPIDTREIQRTVPPLSRRLLVAVVTVGAAFLLVSLIGGYAFDWRWTGFDQHTELWDVLHLLVLPVVIAALPIWYRTRVRYGGAWLAGLVALAVVFVVLVIGGYGLDWTWTGFQGNTLWDWLELLVLPIALGLLPFWLETSTTARTQWRVWPPRCSSPSRSWRSVAMASAGSGPDSATTPSGTG